MKRPLTALVSSTLIALSLSGCMSDSTANTAVEVPFTVAETGYYSGIMSERFEVIKDHSAFTGLWLDHTKGFSPAPAQPDVDFNRDMVIATFLGERATGGYSIAIAKVEEQEESLIVSVKATFPSAKCVVTQAMSQPHQIVTVPRSGKIVALTTAVERVDCP